MKHPFTYAKIWEIVPLNPAAKYGVMGIGKRLPAIPGNWKVLFEWNGERVNCKQEEDW